jgi:ubiquinone biosynthesis accessory factor UbiJ
VSALFPSPGASAINHVLRTMPLAMERLRKHAGRTIEVQLGPFAPAFTIQTTGEVTAALPTANRDLTMRISPALLPRLLARDDAAYRDIEMEGDLELAHEMSFLARHVSWDVEEDLSKWVGDIAAHRIVSTLRSLGQWGREAALRGAQGAAEYWTEESPLIASRVKVAGFVRDVDTLRDDVERLEKRIDRL